MLFPLLRKYSCKLCLQTITSKRYVHTTPILTTFFERDPKGGYKDKRPKPPVKELVRESLQELKQEIALWKQEVKDRFDTNFLLVCRPGEVDIAWEFVDEKSLAKWVVTSDSDHNEGWSNCSLTLTKTPRGLFSGYLSLKVPKDGRIKRSGYCNMKTMPARKSFKRESHLNWTSYNMLVMRVRGDGRSYLLNIHCKGYFDLTWNDMYHYVLYTRGGPYWQTTRIPFSKFFLASKGRIQDRQSPLPLDKITSFGITAAERFSGDFSLEIDYIGLEYDPNHTEEFAYEMYETQQFIAST